MILRLRTKHQTTAWKARRALIRTEGSIGDRPRSAHLPLAGLLLAGLALGTLTPPVAGVEFNAPRQLEVPTGARPIWSPSRPEQPASQPDASSALRFVENSPRTVPTSTGVTSASVLRWRSHNETESNASRGIIWRSGNQWKNANAPQSAPVTADGSRAAVIQNASYDEDSDPFRDPFGDRIAQASPAPRTTEFAAPAMEDQRRGSTYVAPDESAPAPPVQLEVPAEGGVLLPPGGATEMPVTPPADMPAGEDAPPIPPLDSMLPVPGATDDQGFQPAAPGADTPDLMQDLDRRFFPGEDNDIGDSASQSGCTRMYGENDRNCCSDQDKCDATRALLRTNPITNIDLDITASFQPDTDDLNAQRQARLEQFKQMPSRVWRDRAGRSVATGRLIDLRFRRAVIADENGGEREIPLRHLSDDDLCFLAAWWGVPTECTLGDDQLASRNWVPITFSWKSSGLVHKPLYFEEIQLERYGHTLGPVLQPAFSGAHFFLNVAVLPYKMGINPPNECQYSLGYYRPGSCAPWLVPPVPISLRGGLAQAGAVVGGVYLFP